MSQGDSGQSLLKSDGSANWSEEEKLPQPLLKDKPRASSAKPKLIVKESARITTGSSSVRDATDPTQNAIAAKPSETAVPTSNQSLNAATSYNNIAPGHALDPVTYLSSATVPHGAAQPSLQHLQVYYDSSQQQVYSALVQQQLQPQIVSKQDPISVPMPVTSSYAQSLQFQEDHSGEDELTMEQIVQEPDYSYQDISMPLGGGALTYQEASTFFPALLGSATPAPTSATQFLTQQPLAAFYRPRTNLYDLQSSSSIPSKLVSSKQQMTVAQPQPAPAVSPVSRVQVLASTVTLIAVVIDTVQ